MGRSEFSNYERRHTARTTRVVAPAMLLEMATAGLLLRFRPVGVASWQVWTGVLLLGGIWASTALVQVPCHRILTQGFDPAIHRRLVTSNWMRTAGWSLRALLVTWMLASTSR